MIDYMIEPEERDDKVGTCCMCGEELYSIDEVLIHSNDLYCDYECLRMDIGTFKKELTENCVCGFCGLPLFEGEEVVADLDGSVFCDTTCMYAGYDIEEVYGYDM